MIGFLRLIAGLSSGHVGYGARRTALLALQTAPVLPSCKDNNSQSRPVTEHRPPAWGQQVLQGDYWGQILGTVHRQTSIQIRCRWNYPVPVSQMSSVMQQENRAGTTMTPALNRRPWSTSRRFTPIRRWAGGLIGNDQVSQVDRRGQLAVIPASTAGADPIPRSRPARSGRGLRLGTLPG